MTKGFDEVRIKLVIGKTEYIVAGVKFPFPWILDGGETVIVELFHGKGADLTPRKVAATRVEFI